MTDRSAPPAEPAVDVTRLMEDIKARVRERRASGFYSEDEVRRIVQMELEVTDVFPGLDEQVEHHLALLNDSWEVDREPAITSHRGALGWIIVGAKRLLLKLARPYTQLVLSRQIEFNTRLLHLLNAFVAPAAEMSRKLGDLSLEVNERLAVEHAETVRRHREVVHRLDQVVGELATLRAAVEHARGNGAAPRAPIAPTAVPAGTGTFQPEAYVAFEDRHRGTREEIRERQRGYLPLFAAGPILDVGCGRGEFLELCREGGLEARGVDTDPGMVATCRAAGLTVEHADALAHLAGLADGSLGGVFCSQVIEHLPAEAFVALAQLAHAKLRPGGVLLCETPNPTCLTVFSGAFYVDLSHIKPIHPQAAVFVLETAGFREVEVRYVNPYPPDMRLVPLEPLWYLRRYEEVFLATLNQNFAQLNDLLWGAQDYAAIGRKP
jgi:SAM-dependent methyltransferase